MAHQAIHDFHFFYRSLGGAVLYLLLLCKLLDFAPEISMPLLELQLQGLLVVLQGRTSTPCVSLYHPILPVREGILGSGIQEGFRPGCPSYSSDRKGFWWI